VSSSATVRAVQGAGFGPYPGAASGDRAERASFDHQRVSVQVGAQRALHLADDLVAQLAVLVSA
jgi:hypothetical protein